MSFLLKNKLGNDITSLIYEFTKPKSLNTYKDCMVLTRQNKNIIYKKYKLKLFNFICNIDFLFFFRTWKIYFFYEKYCKNKYNYCQKEFY